MFTSSLAVMVPMMYVSIFMTDCFGIGAAVVATALLVARILDFLISLVAGGMIEMIRIPWGEISFLDFTGSMDHCFWYCM